MSAIEQTDAYRAVLLRYIGDSMLAWKQLFAKRLTLAFEVPAATVLETDFDAVCHAVARLPCHVSMSWIKTISNGWCTNTRFHEPIIFCCLFGCVDALWEGCGCSRSVDRVDPMLPQQLQVEATDSNWYCKSALGALWLQQEHGCSGYDAPKTV